MLNIHRQRNLGLTGFGLDFDHHALIKTENITVVLTVYN